MVQSTAQQQEKALKLLAFPQDSGSRMTIINVLEVL